jgi:hypothetical protein
MDELKMATASSCQQPDKTITLTRKRTSQQLPTPTLVHHKTETLLQTTSSSMTLRRRPNARVGFVTPVYHLSLRSPSTNSHIFQLDHGASIASTAKDKHSLKLEGA